MKFKLPVKQHEFSPEAREKFRDIPSPWISPSTGLKFYGIRKLCMAIHDHFAYWRAMRDQELARQIKQDKYRSLGVGRYKDWSPAFENDLWKHSGKQKWRHLFSDPKFPLAGEDAKGNPHLHQQAFMHQQCTKGVYQGKGRKRVLDMSHVRKLEDRILEAIDKNQDIQDVIDWQLKWPGLPMQEQFTTEEMTEPSLSKAFGLKKSELRMLHLVDAVHGEGLFSKQIAQRERIKAGTVRKRIQRAKKKLQKRLEEGKP